MIKSNTDHLATGQQAEKIAHDYLLGRGLRLIEKNFSCKAGEIDLIMRDGDHLVFVEVRYRKTTGYGLPEETVTLNKQRKIIQAAQYFLLSKKLYDQCPCRFDIVAITGTIPNHQTKWIPGAFDT